MGRMGSMTKGAASAERKKGHPPHFNDDLPEEGFWPRVPIAEVTPEWTVFRCASAATIELPQELRDDHNVLAWSPIIRVQRRLPRRRKTELVVRPLLPSFVFVATHHADEAMELVSTGRVHQMKWFLVNGGPVAIPGLQLGPLHLAQIRGTIRKRPLTPGDRVEILATVLYLAKAQVTKGPLRDDTYEVQIDDQRLKVIFPGFLLRKLVV